MTKSVNGYKPLDTEPGDFHHIVGIEGTGANDPTKLVGRTVNVTRNAAVGKYRYTWPTAPGGVLVDFKASFQATTPSDVKGYTAVAGDFVAPTATASAYIDVWVFDSTFALDDLEAGWKLRCEFTFKTVDA
jgi:hypothetical protein